MLNENFPDTSSLHELMTDENISKEKKLALPGRSARFVIV